MPAKARSGPGRPPLPQEKWKRAIELTEKGLKPEEVAGAIGVSLTKVYEYLRFEKLKKEKGASPDTGALPDQQEPDGSSAASVYSSEGGERARGVA